MQQRDFAVGGRPYVERHTAASRHEDTEMADELVGGQVVFQRLVAVEAETASQTATFRPRPVGERDARAVFRCAEAVLLSVAPAVIDDGITAHGIVVPRNQFGGVPLLRTVAPLAIGEKDGGLVFGNQFLELRDHVGIHVSANVFVRVNVPAVDVAFPFGQGVVETHFEAFFADGLGQFAADVALRPDFYGVPIRRILARPKAKTIVVL